MNNLIENHPETKPFWDAATNGRFLLPHCSGCSRKHWYPRAVCPFCFSPAIEWRASEGRGEIYAFSSNPADPTSTTAYVTLDDGPRLLTNIIGAAAENLAIGNRVKVIFTQTDGDRPFFAFTPE